MFSEIHGTDHVIEYKRPFSKFLEAMAHMGFHLYNVNATENTLNFTLPPEQYSKFLMRIDKKTLLECIQVNFHVECKWDGANIVQFELS